VSGAARAAPDSRLRSPVALDILALAVVTLLSALPYLRHLGFYSDDWGLLADFTAHRHDSLAALAWGFRDRPVQGVYLAGLFRLFGLGPLGYHLVNTAVIAGSACLLYALLVRLRFSRAESFATSLLFVMLPQLSTVRVWYAAFQIPLSMALMLASMHCQLSFARSARAGWLAGAIVTALLSIGAYEIFAPLLAGFAVALAFVHSDGSLRRTHVRVLAAAVLLGAVGAAVLYKLAFSGRTGAIADPARYAAGLKQLVRLDYDWRVDSGLNIIATPKAHFWAPVRGWWRGLDALASGRAGLAVSAIAILIAAIAAWRLAVRKPGEKASAPNKLLVLGIATFVLGNATFLVVPAVVFTSTGMDNRVHVAAAIGVAMVFVSLISLGTAVLPPRHRTAVFSGVIAAISAAAFARLSGIENFWAQAPALQQAVLSAARSDLNDVPASSTIILDGICPYHGPAVVFEESWDLGGALTLALGRPLGGDVMSPRMSLAPGGLETSIYKQPRFYPFGPHLYVYNPVRHVLIGLRDAETAARYFAERPRTACPGFVARGVEV
jgi:hypothetical protein